MFESKANRPSLNPTHPQETCIMSTRYSSSLSQYSLFSYHLPPLLIESASVKITKRRTLSNLRTHFPSSFVQPNTQCRLPLPPSTPLPLTAGAPGLFGLLALPEPLCCFSGSSARSFSSHQPLDVGFSGLSPEPSSHVPPCASVFAPGFNNTLTLKTPTRITPPRISPTPYLTRPPGWQLNRHHKLDTFKTLFLPNPLPTT